MSRTNIDIDDELVTTAMERFQVGTKREAVDIALRRAVGTPLTKEFLQRLTDGLIQLSLDNRLDFHHSAGIYREARSRGKRIRKLYDCLIAAVALRTDAVLVHCDRDFDHLAEVFPGCACSGTTGPEPAGAEDPPLPPPRARISRRCARRPGAGR
ncbi:type II toxin-antitoxin system VapB family antitoxin [Nocardiopsis deserti]|uniref:type II toxin-antitoxin system VapB family antitoxin n=1 Tax=Nocardiopsis deserti TaxID=2605988 RepID=UPI001CC24C7B|nr:type II toxin-antitoxin system VapB family antitoxin [Nocardiopsis deserti]